MAFFKSVRTVVVTAVMVAAVAATGIYAFGYWARQAARAELLLVQIREELHDLNSLEWQSIAKGTVDAAMQHRVFITRVRIAKLRVEVKGSELGMRAFDDIYRNFTVAMDREFALIKSGKLDEARAFDDAIVDPLFHQMYANIREMTTEHAAAKERIGRIADVGMALSLLSAAMVVAAIFSAFTTSRSRQVKKLNEARELAELSFDSAWEQDEQFRFTSVSTEELGKGPSPLMTGATLWQLPVSPDGADWSAHRATLEAHQPFKNFEYKLLAEGMPVEWISISGKPQFDENGKFTGYRGTTRNITDRKQVEEALRQSQSALRQLAAHQDAVKENERKRIARDIHDELGQNLLALRLDVVRMTAKPDLLTDRKEQVAAALKQIDTIIKSVRAIINDLRPSVLDLGLHAAIQWQAKEFERRSGISCQVHIDHPEFRLDDQLATALFRSVQESLSNIIRHAQASQVWIDMQMRDGQLYMKIADDGIGGDPGLRPKEHAFGLIGIEERMIVLGGTFSRTSEPDQGMTIMLSVPV